MAGLVNASINENLLWNIERCVSNVFIPLLNTNGMGDRGSDQLLFKVQLCIIYWTFIGKVEKSCVSKAVY